MFSCVSLFLKFNFVHKANILSFFFNVTSFINDVIDHSINIICNTIPFISYQKIRQKNVGKYNQQSFLVSSFFTVKGSKSIQNEKLWKFLIFSTKVLSEFLNFFLW